MEAFDPSSTLDSVNSFISEDEKPKLTADQRKAISDERTKQLTHDLDVLKSTENEHQEGERQSKKKQTDTSRALKLNFGPEDVASPRNPREDTSRYVSMPSSDMNTSGIGDLQLWEEKRRSLAQALHREEAFIMNRRIDGITYSLDEEPPFEIPIKLVLQYVAFAMDSGFREKRKLLFYLIKPVTRRLVLDLFWFVHCFSFQPDSVVIQEVLIQSISDLYVDLRGMVTSNRELFFDCFPFAAAYAVDRCFHHFIPGSRILYTSTFKLQTYLVVARLLTGIELSAVTVQNKMLSYFPSENLLSSLNYYSGRQGDQASSSPEKGGDDTLSDDEGNSEDVLRPLRKLPAALWKTSKRDRVVLGDEGSTQVESIRSLPLALTVPLLPNAAEVLQQSRMDFTQGDDRASAAAASVKRKQEGPSAEGDDKARVRWNVSDFEEGEGMAVMAREAEEKEKKEEEHAGDLSEKEKRQRLRQQHESQLKAAGEALYLLMRRSNRRQMRVKFNVSNMSPLIQRHLRASSSVVGRPVSIKRTTPVPWCRVGGLDTFRAAPPVAKEQRAIMREATEARQAYTVRAAKQRMKDRIELKAIESACEMVRSGAVAHVSRFAAAVVEARKLRAQAQHEERRQRHSRNKGKVAGSTAEGSSAKKPKVKPRFSKPARDSPLMKHSDVLPQSTLSLPENMDDSLLYASSSGIAFMTTSDMRGVRHGPMASSSKSHSHLQPVHGESIEGSAALKSTLPPIDSSFGADNFAETLGSKGKRKSQSGGMDNSDGRQKSREKIIRSAKHMLATIDLPLGPNAMKTFDVGAGDTTALNGFTPRKSSSMYGISLLPGGGTSFTPARTGLPTSTSVPSMNPTRQGKARSNSGRKQSSALQSTLPDAGIPLSASVTKLLEEAMFD